MNDHESVLFLKAGDQYILRIAADPKPVEAFLMCTYDLYPQLIATATYQAQRNPVDQILLDQDARSALQLAQSRELNVAELFFISKCLPSLWAKYGLPITPSITSPTEAQVRICTALANVLSDPIGKLTTLAETSTEWRTALSSHIPELAKPNLEEIPVVRPRLRM